jgi:hypothetical protein
MPQHGDQRTVWATPYPYDTKTPAGARVSFQFSRPWISFIQFFVLADFFGPRSCVPVRRSKDEAAAVLEVLYSPTDFTRQLMPWTSSGRIEVGLTV